MRNGESGMDCEIGNDSTNDSEIGFGSDDRDYENERSVSDMDYDCDENHKIVGSCESGGVDGGHGDRSCSCDFYRNCESADGDSVHDHWICHRRCWSER